MSKFVCNNGILTFADSAWSAGVWEVNNVTIDINAETVDYPTMGNSGWTDNLASTKSAEFTWETALDDVLGIDLDNVIGQESELVFLTSDGPSYTAENLIITGVSINTPVDDVSTVSWTGASNGEITEDVSS